jgi:hypothetical protein
MEKSKMLPNITFNGGILQIRGRSIPDDALLFYEPLMEEVNEYVKKPLNETIARVDVDYVSTDSSKILLEIMKVLNTTPNFSLEWMYDDDDEDIQELGEFYQDILKINVKFLPKH